MPKTYTYDPTKMAEGGKDQMRFELQDTAVEGGEETCVLCDEEYTALIDKVKSEGRGFRYAKYKCVEAAMMKLAYEVDFSAGGMSLSLSQRYDRFRKLWLQMQASFQKISAAPSAIGKGAEDGGHYFRAGMNDNPRVALMPSPFREV